MSYLNHWIPAFAGMTAGGRLGCCQTQVCRNDRELSGWRPTLLSPRCHSGAGRNPGRLCRDSCAPPGFSRFALPGISRQSCSRAAAISIRFFPSERDDALAHFAPRRSLPSCLAAAILSRISSIVLADLRCPASPCVSLSMP